MKNINFKKGLWWVLRFLWNVCAVVGLCIIGYFFFLISDDKGYCLSEQHGVWDDNQKICRFDCIKWDKDRGCLKEEDLPKAEASQPTSSAD